jgi:hypothetical protein
MCFGILSFAIGATLLVSEPVAAAEQVATVTTKSFVARDATRYRENPNLAPYGVKNIVVVYESSMWPRGADRSEPDTKYIARNVLPQLRKQKPDVVVIDIERWYFKYGMTATEITANINKYKKVIATFRSALPDTKLGLYSMLPERNWNAICGDPKKAATRSAAWHSRNLKLQPLADAVDIIFPSLYTIYPDQKSNDCWASYAKANIAEAKMYGKPVWPFLWMKNKVGNTWVSTGLWRQMLETVHEHADGVVLWSMASARDKWSWSAPWWKETTRFLKQKGLAK